MSRGIFVVGTGTDVGKTYVSALLVKALRERGIDAGYFKPALSGAYRREGVLIPGDAEYVCQIAGLPGPSEQYVACLYEPAVSPHLAARLEGRPVREEKILGRFQEIGRRYAFVVAEGCGGIFCPLRTEEKTLMLTDVAAMLGLDLALVSQSGLGSINAAVLAAEHAARLGFCVRGIFLNQFEEGNPMHADNRAQIERFTGLPAACVREGAKALELPRWLKD